MYPSFDDSTIILIIWINSVPRFFMDLPQILKMADPITVSEDSFIKNGKLYTCFFVSEYKKTYFVLQNNYSFFPPCLLCGPRNKRALNLTSKSLMVIKIASL